MSSTPTSNELAIKLTNVSKYYKLYEFPKYRLLEVLHPGGKVYHEKYYAINNMDLEVKKGEVIGIVGKNGSGKSTLLKLITGVLTPDRGEIQVNGKISALLELGSGFNPEFTGMQNIYFYGMILGFSRQEMGNKLHDILAFADIGEFINQPLKTYSSGMRARLGFAVAVHIDPEILILDEVLAVGDVLFKRKCYAKMKEFFDAGKTILYVSHDVSSVKELCSRAVFLLDGNIVLSGEPKVVTHYYEKYQFSSKEGREVLKKEMEELGTGFDVGAIVNKKQASNNNNSIPKVAITESDEYLPSFVSSPHFGNSNLATFDNIGIYNSENKLVNVLRTNHTYRLTFTVVFNKKEDDLYFGAEFLTIKGNLISSVDTKRYKNNAVYSVEPDDTFEIEIIFECSLLPEVYLINVFVNNDKGGLTIHDAYIYKVKPASWHQGGLVHLKQTIQVNKANKNQS